MKKLDAVLADKHLIAIARTCASGWRLCRFLHLQSIITFSTYYPDADVRLYLEPIPNIFKFYDAIPEEIKSEYTR